MNLLFSGFRAVFRGFGQEAPHQRNQMLWRVHGEQELPRLLLANGRAASGLRERYGGISLAMLKVLQPNFAYQFIKTRFGA